MSNTGNEIVRSSGNQLPALNLPQNELILCQLLNQFNQLRAYRLTAVEVLEWKDTIVRLIPEIDLKALQCAIDGMITGAIPYDDRLGIRNIFAAMQRVVNENGRYKILKPIY